jgi:thymidylate synthase (FAD)
MGAATNVGWSANIRTLRHTIEMRTAPGAEEEIRFVFGKVAEKAKARYSNLFSDYQVEIVKGLPWYKTEYSKV